MLADGFMFLESPRWHDGQIFVSDFYAHRVFAIEESGAARVVCEVPNQPSGLGFAPDGSMLVVSMLDRRILRMRGGTLELYADLSQLVDHALNDMLVDRAGRAYVGNLGFDARGGASIAPTCLLVVQPDGSVVASAKDLVFPNGMAVTPDGAHLLVAETYACRISAFALRADGTLGDRSTWAVLGDTDAKTHCEQFVRTGQALPDGIAVDADGALWVADANGTGINRIDAKGRVLDRIETGLAVYAAALGGVDGHTLFLCVAPSLSRRAKHPERASAVLTCQVDVPAPDAA